MCRRLLIDVFFATLLRRHMVERRCDVKLVTLQRRRDVVCVLGEKYSSR